MAKAIMVQGTASDAGKSLITAALCRIFARDGYKTAPFKSQNMALNSFITPDGFEIGRAQAVQAEAAMAVPDVRMNPVLLKPTSDSGSQVIVNGKPFRDMPAWDYYEQKLKLRPFVVDAYESLARDYDVIVIEGAGSPAEINLAKDDYVNMGMAKIANAPVLLVGDIDKGGVFASLYGTCAIIEPDERERIKGLIINKFRGDIEILRPGLKMIEDLCHKPVLGVIPYGNYDIEDEDSVSARVEFAANRRSVIDIAVVRLPRISNFTDFNPLERIPGLTVRYVFEAKDFGKPDLLIIPGSKNTMADLQIIRQNGLEALIKRHAANGGLVLGICGGYQMLGTTISDPDFAEAGGEIQGLGLLPVDTIFKGDKTTVQVTGSFENITGAFAPLSGTSFEGYEIHMGESVTQSPPLTRVKRGKTEIPDGAYTENIAGTYIHGLFDSAETASALAKLLADRKGVTLENYKAIDSREYKETQYDKLANEVREALNMDAVYKILNS
ncbi:MAG: cobyric acid synthase [Oscillospiraceae bacterium]|jgi:adenosylcobyric acid synthase|nr:cobyric acid synthase [Oscillospiraceae bacterium]